MGSQDSTVGEVSHTKSVSSPGKKMKKKGRENRRESYRYERRERDP